MSPTIKAAPTIKVTTTADAIDALGGNQLVAHACHTTHKAVSNWRAGGKFPAATYLLLRERFRQRGIEAPDRLWAMRQITAIPSNRRRFANEA